MGRRLISCQVSLLPHSRKVRFMTDPGIDATPSADTDAAIAALTAQAERAAEMLGRARVAGYEAASGDGLITARATGAPELTAVELDPRVFDRLDHAGLTAALTATIAEVLAEAERGTAAALGELTS